MVEKEKACKNCGTLTTENICPNCSSKIFSDKYKGKVIIFDAKKSKVAEKLKIEKEGKFALRF